MGQWQVGWNASAPPTSYTTPPVRRKKQRRQEGYGPDWNAFLDVLVERYRDGDQWFLPPGGHLADRDHRGADAPLFQTEMELAILRQASKLLVARSTLAQGAINGLSAYVIEAGYSYKATPKENVRQQALATPDQADDQALVRLAAQVQAEIDDFCLTADWPAWEQELFWRSLRDGEFFLRLHDNAGRLQVRVIEPEQIGCRPGDPEDVWSFGVGTRPEDVACPLEYAVRWRLPGGDEWEYVDAADLIHGKRNTDRNIKRGLPDFAWDAELLLRTVGKLLFNMAQGSSIQAAIALIRQYATGTESEITTINRNQASETRVNPLTRRTEDVVDYPAGTIISIPEGQEYKEPPYGQYAANHQGVVQTVCQGVAAKWNAPAWLISGDASNNNFASSVVAESPFNRRCKKEQGFYRRLYGRVMQRAVQVAVSAGRLPPAALHLIDVQATAPSLTVRNKLEEANENSIYLQAGVKSVALVQEEQGIDSDRVTADRRQEQELRQQQAAALGHASDPGRSAAAKKGWEHRTKAATGEPPQAETKP